MHLHVSAILAAVLLCAANVAGAANRDMSKLTCGDFLASGQASMAVIIMWLRGYHAGRTGTAAYNSADSYAARLGYQCGGHRRDNLLDTSERILSELDRGI